MFNVLSRRRVMTNSSFHADGSLVKEDPLIEELRSEIKAMKIANSENERLHMNNLTWMEKEHVQALNLMNMSTKATVVLNSSLKTTEESLTKKVANLEREAIKAQEILGEEKIRSQEIGKLNSSLKVANNSLMEKVGRLEIKVSAATTSSDEETTFSGKRKEELEEGDRVKFLQNQVKDIEKLKNTVTSTNEDNKAIEKNIQKLHSRRAQIKDKFGHRRLIERQRSVDRKSYIAASIAASIDPCVELNDLKDKYNEEVKRNKSLEEQIQIIVMREDITNKCLAQTKRDAENTLIQRNKVIDAFREELNMSRENILRLEEKIQSMEEGNSHEGPARLITQVDLCKKVEEKEEEVKGLTADDINSVTLLLEKQKSATAEIQVQLQQKEELIDKMNKISCKKSVTKQTYSNDEIEELKIELQRKNTKIECIFKENEKNLTGLKQKETDFHLIIQKHQVKLAELDEMREKYEAELELNSRIKKQVKEEEQAKGNETLRKSAVKHERCLQRRDSEIDLLKDKLTRANADEQDNLRENADLHKTTLEHDERFRNQRKEIDDLKKKLINANVAKSEIEVNLKELRKRLSHSIKEKEDKHNVEKEKLKFLLEDVGKKFSGLERELKEKEAEANRMGEERSQMYKNFNEQTAAKKNEISELHEELLEKSNLLTVRERALQSLKYEADEKKLHYQTKIMTLRAELKIPRDKNCEVERLSARNSELEYDIVESKQEVKQMRGKFANMAMRDGSDGIVRILRNRNECLKNEVEALTNRMKDITDHGPSEM